MNDVSDHEATMQFLYGHSSTVQTEIPGLSRNNFSLI